VERRLLAEVLAQETAIGTLRRAVASGRVHHAYLFTGPDGVGKELAAFGLAQALVCERRQPGDTDGCGACSACLRTIPRDEGAASPGAPGTPLAHGRSGHPDVVVLERGLYEPAQIGRRTPETQEISIDQVRTLVLARAAFPPHEGRAKVILIRRADELSTAAANALLKTLEEPGRGTHFILLTSAETTLLSTIRSRTQRVRFAPLPEDVVARLMVARGVAAEQAAQVAQLAGGSVEAAQVLADPDESARRERFVARARAALDAKTLEPSLELAEEAKKGGKERLAEGLAALANALAREGRSAAEARDPRADLAAARYSLALAAQRQLDGNASPQLVVESMLTRMRSV
jgi:DNA polymerase-3 subunit delta'